MRLSILSTMAEAAWGGSEELWAGTATAALEAGWQVQALLPHFPEQHPKRAALAQAGVALSSWTYDALRKWSAAANSADGVSKAALNPYRGLTDPRPDLVLISHGGLMDMVNAHAGLLSELWSSGVPYVVVIQANTEGYWPTDAQRHFMRGYFGGALQVIFVSRQNLEFARRQLADPLANAVVWQQPVNLATLKMVKWPKEPTLTLASVARLDVLAKGQDMLLEILSTPVWRARRWKLNLYGTGPSLGLLKESAALGGIGERVQFHGQVGDVAQIWRANQVLVMPSRHEGTPLALLEALCCGRPVLATDVGGSADWLIAGLTGFVAEAARVEQLAAALERLWENRERLAGMGEAAAHFFARSFHPRPGDSLLRYLEAQLHLLVKAGAVGRPKPLLSLVRVVTESSPTSYELNGHAVLPEGIELITVFAGSTGPEVADRHTRVLHEPRGNPAVAANTGLFAASGHYGLLVENAQDVSTEVLEPILAALRAQPKTTYFCVEPAAGDSAVPLLGVFALHAWRAAGGYPANVLGGYQTWFWRRLRASGERIATVAGAAGGNRLATAEPRVTVVVTCYNYAGYLERCIDSVLAQEFQDFEILIVNDGSTDISPLVADWIAALHPGKIRVLHQANSGQPAIARNQGVRLARGELILPLDADDWIAPALLRECVATFDADPSLGVAYTDTFYCRELGPVQLHPAGEFSVASLRENNRLSCCSLYRKKVWTTVGGYRTNVRGYEDWDYWLAAAAAGFTGKRVARPLFFYRAKDTGVFAETVAKDQVLRARIKLNNPGCYTPAERAQAEALLASELAVPPGVATTSAPVALATARQAVSTRYQAKDWAGCISACRQALALAPDECDVLLIYADALARQGEVVPALAAMDRLIKLQPGVDEHRQVRARLAAAKPNSATTYVSVVIPCYNQAQYLAEAVASVLAQTYPHWEIVIVNDGSPDDTTAVAQGLILQHPDRKIRLIEKANGGLSDARNAGIRHARGECILPLDADDKIAPTFLAKTVAVLERHPEIAIAYTDWVYFGAYAGTRAAIDYDFDRMCKKENLFTCTSLFRKQAWEAVGGYNPNMTRGVEDWDFWIGCGEKGFVGRRIPEPLFHYRAKDGSMIHTLLPHLPAMFARIILNHPKLYGAETVRAAQKRFDDAQLPPPKPTSVGEEWLPPKTTLAEFQQIIGQAETLVREARLPEALALVEQALRQAPTTECATRAREILDLLRAELAPPAGPAAASAASGGEELFPADEVQAILHVIAAYAEKPEDASVRTQLVDLQQGLMNFIVSAELTTLEKHVSGSLGQVFRALVKSGLSSEPATDAVVAQCGVIDEALATAAAEEGPFDVRPLLARMLCAPAHRGGVTVPFERIPAWLLEDYLGYVLFAPLVFVETGEAERYHDHLLAWARDIRQRTRTRAAEPLTTKVAEYFALRANYIPLYFSNRNTRELAECRAAVIEFTLSRKGAAIDAKLPKRPKGRAKIKVGFLNAHFGAQTETHVTLPSLNLDRSKFELCLFPVARNPGPVEDHCRSLADSFTPLPAGLGQQVKAIREAVLDVLIIGTNLTAVSNQVALLAVHRLAPLQLASYCSPVSTGMRHIDGYLTGTLNDYPGLQEHFTEKLRLCDGPPGCLDYTVESPGSGKTFSRAGLGLADDDVVFINAAACFKILPEMQETWAKILAAVPKSRLLLLPFNPNWASAFPVKQFERTLTEACARHGVGRDRFVLAGSLPSRADVKALERVADVYLDTSPFSGSISVIDPLELGLPLVVQEGATHRSRMASALLREIELPELITTDEAAYIALAVRLGTDAAYRRQLNERILAAMARGPKFINARAYAQGLGALLESLVRVK